MNTAKELVTQAVGELGQDNVPARVVEIVDRHRQSLLDLANALLMAGRTEEEVIEVIQKASESFSIKFKAETEGLSS